MIEYKKRNLLLAIVSGAIFTSFALETLAQDHTLTSRRFQGIPSLAISPGGRLRAFWAQTIGHDGTVASVWARIKDDPDSDESNWSQPRRLTEGIMMCKPTVLSSGEWILPASTWRDTDNSARVVVSTDKGQTFSLRGACNVPVEVRNYDEHMIVERKDRSLWMLVRTSYGIGESISKNRGKTWSTLGPSSIHIIYDYSRTGAGEILMSTFTEEDVVTGNTASSTVSLRMVVSKFEEKNQE